MVAEGIGLSIRTAAHFVTRSRRTWRTFTLRHHIVSPLQTELITDICRPGLCLLYLQWKLCPVATNGRTLFAPKDKNLSTNTSMIVDLLIRGSSRYASLACLSEIYESLYGQTTSAVPAYAVILLGMDVDGHHSSGVPDIEAMPTSKRR